MLNDLPKAAIPASALVLAKSPPDKGTARSFTVACPSTIELAPLILVLMQSVH